MSVVVAVRDEDRIWLATDSQVTSGWTKSLLMSQHSFKIFKGKHGVLMGGVGSLRDINIVSTSDTEFISEIDILKNNVNFKSIVRSTVPRFFTELKKFNRIYVEHGMEYLESNFIIAHGMNCYQIDSDGCVQELNDMFAIGSGGNIAESAYTVLRDTELSAKDKAIRAVISSCERDLFVDYPIVVTDTLTGEFEIFDGNSFYKLLENGDLEEIPMPEDSSEEEESK